MSEQKERYGRQSKTCTCFGSSFRNIPVGLNICKSTSYFSKSNNDNRDIRLFSAPPHPKELITKRIAVEITDTKEKVDATEPVRQEEIDGVDEIAKVGYVKITDSETATYYYQMVNTSDSAEFNTLMEYAERLNSKYADLNIYDKVQFCSDFYNLYSKLVEEAEWQEVENMIINQPEESVKGDKYVLLLRKVDGNEETIDAQFLTAYDDYEPNVITEQVVKEETAKLPITSDSIVLFVVLGIVVIALVVIFIRIKVLSKKENNK